VPRSPKLWEHAPSTGKVRSVISRSGVAVALSGGLAPTGSITFTVFGPEPSPPSSCSAAGKRVGTAAVSGNATYHPSAGFTPSEAGDYWWYARYGGDASDRSAASKCGALTAKTVVHP
jgi:hypothetical protein